MYCAVAKKSGIVHAVDVYGRPICGSGIQSWKEETLPLSALEEKDRRVCQRCRRSPRQAGMQMEFHTAGGLMYVAHRFVSEQKRRKKKATPVR